MAINALTSMADDGARVVSWDRTAQPTYRVAVLGATPAATPTDFITIVGSASKTIRIKRIALNGVATAKGNMPVQLVRRSSAHTGGTAVAQTAIKHDTKDLAATATINLFTANPTSVGTAVGNLGIGRMFLPATGSEQPFPLEFDFCWRADKAIVLRGTSDILAINLAGAAVPSGGVIDFEIEWEEDNS